MFRKGLDDYVGSFLHLIITDSKSRVYVRKIQAFLGGQSKCLLIKNSKLHRLNGNYIRMSEKILKTDEIFYWIDMDLFTDLDI